MRHFTLLPCLLSGLLSVLPGSFAAAQTQPAAPAASAAETLRPIVGTPLQAAQDLLKAGNAKEALAKVNEAAAVSDKTPYEAYIVERMRNAVASAAGDTAALTKSGEWLLSSGRLSASEQQIVLESLSLAHYNIKDYPAAITWATRYFREGGSKDSMRTLLGQSHYLGSNYADAVKELAPVLRAGDAAGKTPTLQQLQILGSAYGKINDEAGYLAILERLVVLYPTRDYWADLLARTENRKGFAERLTLDMFRLRRAAGTLEDAAEYTDMVSLLQAAGYPLEARQVVDEGFAKGQLGKGANAAAHAKLRDSVAKAATEDQAFLTQADATAARARTGEALVKLGYALVTAGQTDKGLAFMEQGAAKGDIKRADDVRLLLGHAAWQAGRKDKAVETFKTVSGSDGAADIGRLWALLAARK